MGNSFRCEGTINAQSCIQVLEHHMLPSRHPDRTSLLISARQWQATACTSYSMSLQEKSVASRLACVQSRHFTLWKCMVHYEAQNTTTETPIYWATRCASNKNRKEIHFQYFNNYCLFSSQTVLSVVRRKGEVTQWYTCSCPKFFGTCCRQHFRICVYFPKKQ